MKRSWSIDRRHKHVTVHDRQYGGSRFFRNACLPASGRNQLEKPPRHSGNLAYKKLEVLTYTRLGMVGDCCLKVFEKPGENKIHNNSFTCPESSRGTLAGPRKLCVVLLNSPLARPTQWKGELTLSRGGRHVPRKNQASV